MEINFNKEYLRDLYKLGQADKKHRFQPQIVKKYIRINVLGLTKYKALNYEHLIGDKDGLSSVRINNQYRIEFEEYIQEGQSFATICNITELSNL